MIPILSDKEARFSVILSVVFHAGFILVAMMCPVNEKPQTAPEEKYRFHVKAVDLKTMSTPKPTLARPEMVMQNLKSSNKPAAHTFLAMQDIPLGDYLKTERPSLNRQTKLDPKMIDLKDTATLSGDEFERILSRSEEKRLKDQVPAKQRSTSQVISEADKVKASKKYQISDESLLKSLTKPLEGLMLYSPDNMAVDPDEGMPGFTPTHSSQTVNAVMAMIDSKVQELKGDVTAYESIDSFLDIEVARYEHPGETKKYFMIKIFPKKGQKSFEVMTKEILFLIDCSLSMNPDRLEEFKKGIKQCLLHLNEGDLFNIVAFQDKTTFFSATSIQASQKAIAEAERFVMSLSPSRQTDVHNAFKQIVEKPLRREPSDIFLLSDGKPTHGVVDTRELLNAITRANGKKRPVFVYSGGGKVNRYLLDFIAYQNRGWSQYTKKTSDVKHGLFDFYQKIKDPIFLHLRYRLHGLNESEVYPKSLPDFFANAQFTLYGSYTDEDVFSMQLLGDIDGKTKELVFSRLIREAKMGNEDIRKGYAFNKIYYLINQVTLKGNEPKLLAQINELSKQYAITTPYSPEIQNLD